MPWCPDCRKQNPPVHTQKEPGQGYCKHHQRVRVRTAYTLRKQAADPTYIHPEQRASALDTDLRAYISRVGASNVTLEFIKNMYAENALAPLSDEELRRMYLPSTVVDDVRDDLDLSLLNRPGDYDLSALKVNPYD